MEPPFTAVASGLDILLTDPQRRGHRLLLAHSERCPAFHRDPQMLSAPVRGSILTSITAGSLVGQFGETVRRFALELARNGMIHNVASDAHDGAERPLGMAAEIEHAGLDPLAQRLTEEVPAAIFSGQETIPPPAGRYATSATSAQTPMASVPALRYHGVPGARAS